MAKYQNYNIVKYNIFNNDDTLRVDINETNELVQKKIELFIENYFYNNLKNLLPDYINQFIKYSNYSDNIINILKNIINKYLIDSRYNMRLSVKKGNLKLNNLNDFLESFINKLNYIISLTNNKNIDSIYNDLYQIIILDYIIYTVIENNILKIDYNNKVEIIRLINFLEKIKINSINILDQFTKNIGNIFLKNILQNKNYPLSDDINKIQIYFNNIKYLNKIDKYYIFIKNNLYKNNIKLPIYINIINNFCDILNTNKNIYDIECLLNNTFDIINNFLITQNTYTEYKNNIFNKFINLLNIMDFNNCNEILVILNIIKYIIIFTKENIQIAILKAKLSIIEIKENIIDIIINYINKLINNSNINDITYIINIISYLKNSDIFINKYYIECTKRLLYYFGNANSESRNSIINKIDFENKIYKILKIYFNENNIFKIYKIITDSYNSYKMNLHSDNSSIFITSYDVWQINQSEGFSNINENSEYSNLITELNNLNINYQNNNKNKMIKWLLHYGEIIINFNDQILTMLPIQFIILEMFSVYNMILYDTIYNSNIFKNYNNNFKDNIISSLIKSNLLLNKDNYLILNYKNIDNTNLIDVYINNFVIINNFEENLKYELCLSRENIISTNINHVIKHNKFTFDELYDKIKNIIKIFIVSQDIFKKTLENMVDMDYIKLNEDNKYIKIYY